MVRKHVTSGTEWESRVGYSRAVRVGDQVHVSGTTPTDDEGRAVGDGPREQTAAALDIVVDALEEAGASAADVVRTRLYVTDIDQWEAIGSAHADVFGDVRPATSMVEVSRLVDEDYCVEIEATAVLSDR